MDLRLKFNEVAEDYDKFRPTYVPELYSDIMTYSGIDQNSHVLEIGIGTGQATLPILKSGCSLTAIELGDKLAEFSKKKFEIYHNFKIVNTAFEDYICPENSFNMIYSASAFHWIPEEIGYQKVYNLLKSGGTFARFANHPYRDKENEPLDVAIQKVMQNICPISSLLQSTVRKCAKTGLISVRNMVLSM